MRNRLTYAQAIRRFGGIRKMRSVLDSIGNPLDIRIFAEHQFNEEEPEDKNQDWLNILFEYKPVVDGNFTKALDDVTTAFYKAGLFLSYECNGDGNGTIIMSYRVNSYR